jgi:hypothetical protein
MRLIRFYVPAIGVHKYVAVLMNDETGRQVKVPFGDKRYQQYHDKIGYWKELDHGDTQRRRLYRIRHAGEEKKKYSPGWFAWNYLW